MEKHITRESEMEVNRVLVDDEAVYAFAEDHDCSLLVARETLEAEAFADFAGVPVDYQRGF